MLSKDNRLNRKEFDQVFKNNKCEHSDHFVWLESKAIFDRSKYAVVVSKKVFSRRVDRNYLRRVIYHAIQSLLSNGQINSSGIIMIKKSAKNLFEKDINQIRSEVAQLLMR